MRQLPEEQFGKRRIYKPKRFCAECRKSRTLNADGICWTCNQKKLGLPFKPDPNKKRQKHKPPRYCPECKSPRRVLGPNGICKGCTESFGLRICEVCKELKLIQSDFDFAGWHQGNPSYKRTCTECQARASSA